jgi:hypothetical protein
MTDPPGRSQLQTDPPAPAFARSAAAFIGGLAMMLLGVAAVVGGLILHFAEKAERFVVFPYAGRLTVVVGIAVIFIGIVLAGTRAAVIFGGVILAAGIGMLAFGFVKLAEPSLRFYAPLGFFVSLAGGFIIWGSLEYAKEVRKKPISDADLLG